MLNRWISKRVNVVSLIIALVYWILACMVFYDILYIGLNHFNEPYFGFPDWLVKFLSPGFFLGLISIFFGSAVFIWITQLFNLLVVIIGVRIIVVFFFALFGWEEE